ncbi:unnamed protein product [Thelazia callipaeda]|uniref:Uncharacterized protein n=1 Tax=Thelazia callipaeda TaxID=103827 RepID=A0A0N5CSU1_THECL|nr:unnamed protein product [Thelazia callipaeda]
MDFERQDPENYFLELLGTCVEGGMRGFKIFEGYISSQQWLSCSSAHSFCRQEGIWKHCMLL